MIGEGVASPFRCGSSEERCRALDICYSRRRFAEAAYAWWSVAGTLATAAIAVTWAWREGSIPSSSVMLCATMLVLTGLGVSAGLHRHFSHNAFSATPRVRRVLAVLGIASGQGYFIRWVHDHRVHHNHTDRPGDPHSPYFALRMPMHWSKGLAHAHFLWLLRARQPVDSGRVRDLATNDGMVTLDRLSPWIVLAGVVIPGAISLVLEAGTLSFFRGVLWGGCVRMFLLNHIVWGVNSFGHRFGTRLPEDRCMARNNVLLGVIAFGDGWHANHHRAPFSARHGWTWWQVDVSWYLIRLLTTFGWVSNVRSPPRGHLGGRLTK